MKNKSQLLHRIPKSKKTFVLGIASLVIAICYFPFLMLVQNTFFEITFIAYILFGIICGITTIVLKAKVSKLYRKKHVMYHPADLIKAKAGNTLAIISLIVWVLYALYLFSIIARSTHD